MVWAFREAFKFSFFISIPVILGGSLLKMGDMLMASNKDGAFSLLVLFISSAVFGCVALYFFERTLRLYRYANYTFVLAIFSLLWYIFLMREEPEEINLVSAKLILKKSQCKVGFVEFLEEGYLESEFKEFINFIRKYSLEEGYEISGYMICTDGKQTKKVSLDSFEDWLETLTDN